jgi:hypothetical protein
MRRLRMGGAVLLLLLYAFMTWSRKILPYKHLEHSVKKPEGFNIREGGTNSYHGALKF